MSWPIFCLTRLKCSAARLTTEQNVETVAIASRTVAPLPSEFSTDVPAVSRNGQFSYHREHWRQVNALDQCREYQAFAVRAVSTDDSAFSTWFSTFLLKTCPSRATSPFLGVKKMAVVKTFLGDNSK